MIAALLAALAVQSSMPASACTTGVKPTSATGCTFVGQGVASISPSFTNTSGTLLVCGVSMNVGNSSASPTGFTSVTYGGTSMGTADKLQGSGTTFCTGGDTNCVRTASYHLLTPSTGAQTLVVTPTVTSNIFASCISFTGNDTSAPIGVTNSNSTGSGAGISVALASTTSGNIVVDMASTGGSFSTSTQTWMAGDNKDGTTTGNNASSSRATSAGGTVTMSYTGATDNWGIVAVEVKAAAAASGVVPHPRRTLRGAGQ